MEPPIPLRFACPKTWGELEGQGERRHCDVCDLHVHNLSLMTRERAEAFLAAREGRQCIAYRCDARGRVIHAPRARWFGRVGALLALCLAACRKAPAPPAPEAARTGEVAQDNAPEDTAELELMGY